MFTPIGSFQMYITAVYPPISDRLISVPGARLSIFATITKATKRQNNKSQSQFYGGRLILWRNRPDN
jgi:hypothetical protein